MCTAGFEPARGRSVGHCTPSRWLDGTSWGLPQPSPHRPPRHRCRASCGVHRVSPPSGHLHSASGRTSGELPQRPAARPIVPSLRLSPSLALSWWVHVSTSARLTLGRYGLGPWVALLLLVGGRVVAAQESVRRSSSGARAPGASPRNRPPVRGRSTSWRSSSPLSSSRSSSREPPVRPLLSSLLPWCCLLSPPGFPLKP